VVDSPPGITKALTVFNSSGFLTFCTATLREVKDLTCSRTSPCSAKTPTLNKSYQPRPANLSEAGKISIFIPTMASPSPRETLAITFGSSKFVVASTIALAL